MTKKECGNGHIYDADIHASCPYCKNPKNTIVFPAGPGELSSTLPAAERVFPSVREPRVLTPPEPPTGPASTLSVYEETCFLDPVAAWMVGVSGAALGRAWELKARNNRIGRSEAMDVRLDGDRTVSWEDYACIDYDRMHDTFTLIPGRFRNTLYLNGEAVYAARPLQAYDRLLLGMTEMMFVPFCGESFRWPLETEAYSRHDAMSAKAEPELPLTLTEVENSDES